jgi:hypothetical protein
MQIVRNGFVLAAARVRDAVTTPMRRRKFLAR